MKKENKTSNTIQAFWVALGSLSSFALSIVSAAILSRYFDKAEYGTYKQIMYVYGSLLVVFSAGLPRVFSYFLPRYEIAEGKAIVWKITKLLFFSGAVFSFFLFVFSNVIADLLNNHKLAYSLKLFSPIPMFLLPTLGIEGVFSTYKKTMYLAVYNTLSRFFMLLFIVGPVMFLRGTYISAIYGWLLASLIILILAYFFKGIPFKDIDSTPTSLSFKEVFTYSIPLVTASLWGMAIKSADQFYISHYFGSAVFAEYSNGFIELPFVSMITASTAVVLMPVFSKIMHNGNGTSDLLIVWRSAILKSAILIYPMVVFFIFFATEIMIVLYSNQYENSGIYFRINMVLNFFNIVIFAPLIFSMGETKFYARLHILIAALAWIGGYVMILLFHSPIVMASFSVFLSILKVIIAMNFVSNKLEVRLINLFPIQKTSIVLFHNILAILVIYTALQFLDCINIYIELVISLIVYVTLLLSTASFFKLNYLFAVNPLLTKFKNVFKI